LCAALSRTGKARLQHMDGRIREMFLAGDLNPALVQIALTCPDYLSVTLETESARYAEAVGLMCEELKSIKRIAATSKTLVLSIPYAAYVSPRSLGRLRGMGFDLSRDCLSSDGPDTAIRSAAACADLECVCIADRFRNAPDPSEAFFEFDGHFTATGHRLFAQLILPSVMASLRDIKQPQDAN
jgi:hypothetical protein